MSFGGTASSVGHGKMRVSSKRSEFKGRTRLWRSKFLKTVGLAKRTDEFRVNAKLFCVCPLLLAEYLSLCVETWSSSDGRAIFPLRRTVAASLGCSVRHVGRLRAAAIAGGWETTVGRYYRDPNGATKRSSNSSRFHLPVLYAGLTDPAPTPVPVDDRGGRGSAAVAASLSGDPGWEAYVEHGVLPERRQVPPVPDTVPAPVPVPVVDPVVRTAEQAARGVFAAGKVAEMRRRLLGGVSDAAGRGPD